MQAALEENIMARKILKMGTPAAAIALALVFGLVFAGCGKQGKGSAQAGDGSEESAASNKSKSTVTKPEDFKYDLTKDGKSVIISQVLTDGTTLKIPGEIEGYPVVEFKGVGKNAVSFKTIVIPDSVTTLGASAFSPSFVDMAAVNNNRELADAKADARAQPGNQAKSYYAMGVEARLIEQNTTRGLINLSNVTLSKNITVIPEGCFRGCKSLKEITIPDSVVKIGRGAFAGCSELTTVKLPNHTIEYENGAFANCPKLSLKVRKAIQESGYTGEF
jgi:hypothetical protein